MNPLTPLLQTTVLADSVSTARQLLQKRGLDPDAVLTPQGSTPLHAAARYNAVGVAELLVRAGATACAVDAASETPLLVACGLGHAGLARLLLAGPLAAGLIEQRDCRGNSALHLAAAGDHLDAVRVLVVWAANVWAVNDAGRTPVQVARERGCRRVREYLESEMAGRSWEGSREFSGLQASSGPAQALELSVLQDRVDDLRQAGPALLSGARPLLHWAAVGDAALCCEHLLGWGADANAADANGQSALHYAALNGSERVCRQLLTAGADVNQRDVGGLTPLMLAAAVGSEAVARQLLHSGRTLPGLADCREETALMHAARQGGCELVRLLLLLLPAAEVSRRNQRGLSALDISEQFGHDAVSALLQEHLRQPLDAYPRLSPKSGFCLIVNQVFKSPALTEDDALLAGMRRDSQRDVNRLLELFQGRMLFRVHERSDLTSAGLLCLMDDIRQQLGEAVDCFVCFVIAHGSGEAVLGTDGQLVPVRDLARPLESQRCHRLAGKPRIFFVHTGQSWGNTVSPCWQQAGHPDGAADAAQLPDFLFAFSAWEHRASVGSSRSGTRFIQTLCDVVEKNFERMDLLGMLGRVCRVVASGPGGARPCVRSGLRKCFRF